MSKVKMTVEEMRDVIVVYNKLIEQGYKLDDESYDTVQVEIEYCDTGFIVEMSNQPDHVFIDHIF